MNYVVAVHFDLAAIYRGFMFLTRFCGQTALCDVTKMRKVCMSKYEFKEVGC